MDEGPFEYIITRIHISHTNTTANTTLATKEKPAIDIKAAFAFVAAADEPPEPRTLLPALLAAVASGGSARLATGIPVVLEVATVAVCGALVRAEHLDAGFHRFEGGKTYFGQRSVVGAGSTRATAIWSTL